jgi:hypothetical protein
MIGFFEKTWFAWWILANGVILRWFHVICSTGAIGPELDRKETAKNSAAPKTIPVYGFIYDMRSGKPIDVADATGVSKTA